MADFQHRDGQKICLRSNDIKPTADFKPSKQTRDGLFQYCRPCDREYQRLAYARRVGGLTHNGKGDRRTAPERFQDFYIPEPMSGCWLWLGGEHGSNGYGRIKVDGKNMMAHRYSWKLHVGEIPEDMLVCHKCDTPLCVNPAHLFLGTSLDNNADRNAKGRTRRGEKHHFSKLTENDVRFVRSSTTSPVALAKRLGVSYSLIRKLRNGEVWAWLTN